MPKPKASPKAKANRNPKAKPKPAAEAARPASWIIDQRIRELGDWRGEALARMRALVLEADPDIVEEVKWVKPTNPWGVAVWSREGIVCTGEVYKDSVKLTFARGASLPDPKKVFNASLEAGTRRAIDVREGDKVDARAFQALVRSAVDLNLARAQR